MAAAPDQPTPGLGVGAKLAFDTAADEVVGEQRAWRSRSLVPRERLAALLLGGGFLAGTALLVRVLPAGRHASLGVALVFLVTYAVVARVEFEVFSGAATPTELVLVPMLFALPLGSVPLVVAIGLILSSLADWAKDGRSLARAALSLVAGCATPRGESGALRDLKAGERPTLDSDEAGLWMAMDRVEANLRTSGRIIADPALNSYVRTLVCRLTPPHCDGIRIYVVQTPHVNASMAPNGMMQIWTGLLLHAENEAQVAYVLGHEIGHYVRRHSVQQFRDLRTKAAASVFFTTLAGSLHSIQTTFSHDGQ